MKKVFFVLLIFIGNFLYAQENNRAIPINLSYFGETILHPGIEIGYANTFCKWFNYTVSIGTYVHQRNHTGLFLSGGIKLKCLLVRK